MSQVARDPAAGTWESPGGRLEPGETAQQAAVREWQEETGLSLPPGKFTGTWRSDNGVYEGFVYTIPHEADLDILGSRVDVANPDNPDPDGDAIEAIAWWDPAHLADNPAVRPELADTLDRVLRLLPAPPVNKCLTCGCSIPGDDHGDHRHITYLDLQAAADAAGIDVEQAAANLQRTLERRIDKAGHHVAGEPYHYRHGWIPIREDLHHFAAGDVATALHEDGSIHVTVHPDGAAERTQLHAEDVPSLVEGIDSALADVEAGHAHESTLLTTTGEVTLHGRPGGGVTIGHGDASLHLTAGEAEQFAQHLDELATAHRPAVIGSHPVSPDLSFDVLSNDRIGVTLGESSVPEPAMFDATEAAELAAILRAARPATMVPGEEREPVDGQRLHPGLAVQWWSDGSVSIDAGQTEVQIPAGHVATAAQILADLAGRLGPVLTAKGARLVRLLAKRADVTKVEEGAVGRYRARHLIRWFERGEGAARIAWGTPGDFDRCVTIASEHMRAEQAKGFCNLRHHGALGFYPATHAAMERAHKIHDVSGELRLPGGEHGGEWTHNPATAVRHLADAVASGEVKRSNVAGGHGTKTEKVTFGNGHHAIHKIMDDDFEHGTGEEQADKEQLASLVAAAVGVRVPAVHRVGPDEVYMDYVDGRVGDVAGWEPNTQARRDQAARLGLFDMVLDNFDRNNHNWIVTPSGDLAAIDHAAAWGEVGSPEDFFPRIDLRDQFSALFAEDGELIDNPMTAADMGRVGQRLRALRPEFDRLGRGNWLDASLQRLADMAEHAAGTKDLVP
jgi:8-oxo-dGTP pyrophosphatase MutT (NUDIX family)